MSSMNGTNIVNQMNSRFFNGQTWVYAPSKLSAWDGSVTVTDSHGRTGPAIDCSHFVDETMLASGYNIPPQQSSTLAGVVNGAQSSYYDVSQTPVVGGVIVFNGHVGIVTSYDSTTGTGTYSGAQSQNTGVAQNVPFNTTGTPPSQGGTYWGGQEPVIGYLTPKDAAYNPSTASSELGYINSNVNNGLATSGDAPYFSGSQVNPNGPPIPDSGFGGGGFDPGEDTDGTAGATSWSETTVGSGFDQVVTTQTNGQISATISGQGDVANLNGATITLTAGTQATVDGSNNGISLTSNDALTSTGGGNNISATSSDLVEISGTGGTFDTINASGTAFGGTSSPGQATGILIGANSQANINGSGDGVWLTGSGTSLGTYGGNNTLVGTGTDNLVVLGNTNGSFDNVDLTGDQSGSTTANGQGTGIYLNSNAQANVNGSTDTVSLNTGDSLGVSGGGDTIGSGAGDLVVISNTGGNFDTVNANGAADGGTTANGQGTGISLNANAQANVNGSGDGINLTTGDSLGVSGGGDTIGSGAGDLVVLNNTGGNFDTVNANGDADGGTTANGQGTGISLSANAQANVNGSGDGINLTTGDSLGVSGGGNTIGSGARDLVVISNTGGNFDTVNANGDADGGTTANGQGTGISLNANAQANVNGSGDGVNLTAGDSLGVYGGSNTVNAGADELVYVSGTNGAGDVLNVSGDSGGTTSNGQSAGIFLAGSTQATVVGNSDSVYGGAHDEVGFLGTGDVISGTGDQVNLDSSGTSVTVIGNDDTAKSNSGGTVGFAGTQDVADLSNGTVNIDYAGTSETINGSHDNIYDKNNDTVSIDGTYDYDDANNTDTTDFLGGNFTGDDATGGGTVEGDGGDSAGALGGYGYGYGYDFAAGSKAKIAQGIDAIASYDAAQSSGTIAPIAGDAARAVALESAAASADGTSNASTIFEGAHWNSKVVTWSVGSGGQFSGSLTTQEEATVEQAFKDWGAASGLTFEEVSGSQQADIQIGVGDFNTSTTGVLGYTSYQTQNGQFQPGVIARIEDPNETALVTGTDGQQTFAGTDATFYQVALHEIGHALGLGDDSDVDSVMYYGASSSNQQIDATDVANIQTLYGSSSTGSGTTGSDAGAVDLANQSVTQLIQAMSSVTGATGAGSYSDPTQTANLNQPLLAASQHG